MFSRVPAKARSSSADCSGNSSIQPNSPLEKASIPCGIIADKLNRSDSARNWRVRPARVSSRRGHGLVKPIALVSLPLLSGGVGASLEYYFSQAKAPLPNVLVQYYDQGRSGVLSVIDTLELRQPPASGRTVVHPARPSAVDGTASANNASLVSEKTAVWAFLGGLASVALALTGRSKRQPDR
jgi:hypothetical protein